jgi:hypothetical protein
METTDEFRERIRREWRIAAGLWLATDRLEEVQQERNWAVDEAHQSGLSPVRSRETGGHSDPAPRKPRKRANRRCRHPAYQACRARSLVLRLRVASILVASSCLCRRSCAARLPAVREKGR